ncbi:MAG: PEP/pyruvate-binding domain-containing protein [Desulfovibrionaceae bacterium]
MDAEHLRRIFKARYHEFKLLLAANTQALEIITELEAALSGGQLFGMSFVRSRATSASAAVLRMVQRLDALAPGKYVRLFEAFKSIQEDIAASLALDALHRDGPSVVRLDQLTADMADLAGGKAVRLAQTAALGLNVPPGFVVTAAAYRRFLAAAELDDEINRRIQAADPHDLDQFYALASSIQALIQNASLPASLEAEIQAAVENMARGDDDDFSLAVRSSALTEDMEKASFAGQFRTVLNVLPEGVVEAYKEVAASLFSAQAMLYRLRLGLGHEDAAMCVACLRMVRPRSAGVLYTRNPMDLRDETMLVQSVWGLPRPVVDGHVVPDSFSLTRSSPPAVASRQVADKPVRYVCVKSEGVCRQPTPESERRLPSLSDEELARLGEAAMTLERHYGRPLDIEWAVEPGGRVVMLQCRPLSGLSAERRDAAALAAQPPPAPVLYEGGVTAAPGAAAGPAYCMARHADSLLFPEGAVLVAAQALPHWAALLDRAAAVVAERGAVASHLANVAREMGVPALFGALGALDALEQGAEVTVDADARRIYQGRIPGLDACRGQAGPALTDTPVHRTLKKVAELILPLHLLDPDSPDFTPANCRTLHDITRFCHEKSVSEMFRFGKEHSFPERAGKQLVSHAPMQWLVLNLDDGFRDEVDGDHVHLENIVSIPMLAIWEGIAAVPWKGPPAVDGAGFMAVMFRATANPALTTGLARSPYSQRNYFMISKNYCSLRSRFGFHFSTVEAMVGERIRENTIRFQFKGGAADDNRRMLRLRFVADILESRGFRTRMHEDNLFARLDNREQEFLEQRLRVLGYLLMHTRQLDMIMADPARVARYRQRFESDLTNVLGAPPIR